MIRLLAMLLLATFGLSLRQVDEATPETVRFESVELWIDPGGEALSAWQVELHDPSGRSSIVGIEGGEPELFSAPPHYDPRALMGGRIVLAAFTTSDAGPSKPFRCARLHVRIEGNAAPQFTLQLQAAADVDGRSLRGASASTR